MTRREGQEIREYIREVLEQRGHTMHQAARAIEMSTSALTAFLRWESGTLSQHSIIGLARYLQLSYPTVFNWIRRDYYRRRDYPRQPVVVVAIEEPAPTWWGVVEQPLEFDKCRGRDCPMWAECRAAADAGRPLPCEQVLERELIPEGAVVGSGEQRWA